MIDQRRSLSAMPHCGVNRGGGGARIGKIRPIWRTRRSKCPRTTFYIFVVSGTDKEHGVAELSWEQRARVATHDVAPQLQKLLANLGGRLPWLNYIHPGDPVAYPLDPLIFDLVDGERRHLEVEDVLATRNDLFGSVIDLVLEQTEFALLNGGTAHDSYFSNPGVAARIAGAVKAAARRG
ncbi:gll0089 [Gloeobacter violaceus PCC 7421]|uniref:Gll0089 protein n=1 Tax=Gloeobacter violaceus (strain ATCC 29082 / PCC 7421) TaxID=251221 RepID=Q7NPG6_GLOVI|nr:gll0089 [Gloeobacter violaceus PCC 7421]